MSAYSMGIDFGTLSGRAVIVDIDTGEEIATSVMEYSHRVMSDTFFDGTPLPAGYALQHPQDYLDTLGYITKDCIEKSGIDSGDIIGVGIDFTASTVIPVYEDGTPLCFDRKFCNNPHAYVKLWKHSAAQAEADCINNLLKDTNPDILKKYGGTTSCEWLLPKVLQIYRECPEVYNSTYRFTEAGDWVVWKLTGEESTSVCMAGFKAMWNKDEEYLSLDFLSKLEPGFETLTDKLCKRVLSTSQTAGYITEEASALTGLKAGTPVAPSFIDAHAALPALGITQPGELLIIIGTSSCHILQGDKPAYVPGTAGYVKDAITEGLYAFEAGQNCVGDCFDWFVSSCVTGAYRDEAENLGISIHQLLTEKAEKISPGSNGILALDWWNGNRTPYVNGNLRGVITGMSINTNPEELYRGLIESTAYGTKRIVDLYEQGGINIDKICAAGGIAEKNSLLMQIYADVLGKDISVSGTSQACAYGSAVSGAVSGKAFCDIHSASQHMKKPFSAVYRPNTQNTEKYKKFYENYLELSRYFAQR